MLDACWFFFFKSLGFSHFEVIVKKIQSVTRKMAPRRKLRCGIGAQCWVYLKYMHPQKEIREFYKNWTSQDKMRDLLVIGREVRSVRGKQKMCVLFRHSSFENVTLYCTKQYGGHVVKEGDEAGIFDRVANIQLPIEEPPQQVEEATNDDGDEIPEGIFNLTGANSEDICHVRNLGFTVDDDNDPAPENIPDNQPVPNTNQTWGWNGIDYRAQANVINVNPTLSHGLPNLQPDPDSLSLASLFMTFFPTTFLFDIILKATNKNINEAQKVITKGELLKFIGIWLFMAITSGFPRRDTSCSFIHAFSISTIQRQILGNQRRHISLEQKYGRSI